MRYYTLLLIGLILLSCSKNNDEPETTPYEITLVYMIADNDLATYALNDLNEMERGFTANGRDKLLVYIDSNTSTALPSHPVLLEIVPDSTEAIQSKIIYTYPEQNSADKTVLSNVLKDVFSYYKGRVQTKGLILWSHGNAWLPNSYTIATENKGEVAIKAFGKDMNPKEGALELPDLAEALRSYHFQYILFDACFMGSIEVLYELRHNADYFIASPAEILADGFPYHLTLPYLIGKTQLEKATEAYYTYYKAQEGVRQSATITLVASRYLDTFADLCAQLPTFSSLPLAELQQYSRNNERYLFDLKQILLLNGAKTNLNTLWQELCPIEKHTSQFANIVLSNCNGLSVYLLGKNEALNHYYKKLAWYKATKLQ
jgi:clostripain-related protein